MSKPILGEGPPTADIVLVGEAGGEEEEAQGRPFVGPSGRLLDSLLADAGIPRSSVYVTNVVKEHPRNNDISPWFSDGVFTVRGQEAKRDLLTEIALRQPKVVIALGATAWRALGTDSRGLTQVRGAVADFAADAYLASPAALIPTFHPAFILRGAWMDRYLLAADLAKAKRLAAMGGKSAIRPRTLLIDGTIDSVLGWIEACGEREEIGFDIETSAGEMTCFSLAHDPWNCMSIPTRRWSPEDARRIVKALLKLLEAPTGPKIVTQNGNYDTSFLREYYGIRTNLARVEDTMCAHHVMYADLGGDEKEQSDGTVRVKRSSKSLALLASLYTFEPYYKDEGGKARDAGDFDKYLKYNAKDAAVTLECWGALKEQLAAKPGMLKTYRDLTLARLPAVQTMQAGGLRVDQFKYINLRSDAEVAVRALKSELARAVRDFTIDRLSTAQYAFEQADTTYQIAKDEQAAHAMDAGEKRPTVASDPVVTALQRARASAKAAAQTAAEPFNPDSSQQCIALFYDFYKLAPRTARRKGKRGAADARTITVDDDALTEFARPTSTRPGYPAAAIIKAIREQQQQIETFLNWTLGRRPGPGAQMLVPSYFRAAFNLRGTKFGRMSSSKLFFRYGGNIQNIPPSVRKALLADPPYSDGL